MSVILEKAFELSNYKLLGKKIPYKRFLFHELKKSNAKVKGLYGARGVGKTTLLIQLLRNINLSPKEAIYISCDHPVFSDLNLFEFLEDFSKIGGKFAFIDEIHKIHDFQKHLKSAYDFLGLKIIFSGSSPILLNDPDMTRRFSMYRLPIMSFREYLELKYGYLIKPLSLKEIISKHESLEIEILEKIKPEKILKLFYEYLDSGAYPFFLEDPDKYHERLNETINATLYYDLAEIYKINIEKISTLKKLLVTICVSKPLELSIDKMSKRLNVSKATLYKYINYLEKGEIIKHISHEAKRFKNIRKPDKLYLSNTNLLKALCLERDKGTLRETFFASAVEFNHSLNYSEKGDFIVDEKFIFEVGGKNKDFSKGKGIKNYYLAIDGIETGIGNKIPLWLFGFLY